MPDLPNMTRGQLGPVSGAQPGKIGDIAQATLVLVQFEHKMITKAAEKNPQGTDRPKDGELAWRMLVSGLLGVWARCCAVIGWLRA
jgi:hypothetical protein